MATEVRPLNSWLADFLHRLHQAELAATGPDRRPAFRRTREAIGAAVASGVPGRDLAECLGVTTPSIRNRAAGLGATITADEIFELTTLTPDAINQLATGRLTAIANEPGPRYRIDDVVGALLALPG